ncbi:Imm21 family immunity protein [Kribbella sp. NPDC051620]|uniref:Imm21 family immunity protein n=1 Tax=Kribbella sp. NPDC051620 TaxID=3364120 RepID=UPI0037A990D1
MQRRPGTTANWVDSMGGPLIVVPVSALDSWRGCTEQGAIIGDGSVVDDYDRACGIDDWAGVIAVGERQALVLGDASYTSCYLPEHRAFIRWNAAGSESALFEAAAAVLADESTPWVDCGVWECDGPAVLMDSAEAGADLGVPYPDGRGTPSEASVLVEAGRWRVWAVDVSGESADVGVVRLLPV